MNQLVLIILLLLADDSTLVKAAKANGGLKKPIPKKTITNKDVKKSTGKIAETPNVGPASAGQGRAEARPTSLAEHEARKKALSIAKQRVTDAQSNVGELEKELGRVEQSYYESSDPSYRDTTIIARFDQTKKQLDTARQTLADARDALTALTPKPSP